MINRYTLRNICPKGGWSALVLLLLCGSMADAQQTGTEITRERLLQPAELVKHGQPDKNGGIRVNASSETLKVKQGQPSSTEKRKAALLKERTRLLMAGEDTYRIDLKLLECGHRSAAKVTKSTTSDGTMVYVFKPLLSRGLEAGRKDAEKLEGSSDALKKITVDRRECKVYMDNLNQKVFSSVLYAFGYQGFELVK